MTRDGGERDANLAAVCRFMYEAPGEVGNFPSKLQTTKQAKGFFKYRDES